MPTTKYIHADIETARSIEQLLGQRHLFELAVSRALQDGHCRDDRHALVCAVADNCHDMGIAEEDARLLIVQRMVSFFAESLTAEDGQAESARTNMEREIELTVANTYTMRRGGFGALRTMSKTQRAQFLLDDFLARNYRLRHNVMTGQTEYADMRFMRTTFQPLTQRVVYQIKERAAIAGIAVSDGMMANRLSSASIRSFNPLDDFLSRLPRWDGTPRIQRLAATIPTDTPEWPERFYRWFLSMVAHWRQPDARFANAVIPVLVGPQGCGKSQWIRALLPVEMWPYYHDGFDLQRRSEAERMMTRYGLINIDEFDAIPPRQEPVLKHLVQLAEVHIDGQAAQRFCSFIATSNHRELHRDTSGSRRYIFVDIKGAINLRHRLSLLQIYAEALAAIRNDERTWFTPSEEAAMQSDNEEFREQDISEQLFLQYYEPLPTRQDIPGGLWLSAIEIYQDLERRAKKDLGIRRATAFGRILTKHCGMNGRKGGNSSRLYHVRLR